MSGKVVVGYGNLNLSMLLSKWKFWVPESHLTLILCWNNELQLYCIEFIDKFDCILSFCGNRRPLPSPVQDQFYTNKFTNFAEQKLDSLSKAVINTSNLFDKRLINGILTSTNSPKIQPLCVESLFPIKLPAQPLTHLVPVTSLRIAYHVFESQPRRTTVECDALLEVIDLCPQLARFLFMK